MAGKTEWDLVWEAVKEAIGETVLFLIVVETLPPSPYA